MQRQIVTVLVVATLVGVGVAPTALASSPWQVAAATPKKAKVHFAAVSVNRKEVLRLADTPDYSARDRADEVNQRLKMILTPQKGETLAPLKGSDVVVQTVVGQPVIRARNQNIIAVTPQDAQLNGQNSQALAQRWASDLRGALQGIKIAKGKPLPENLITIATGTMEMPKEATVGGGGGKASPKPSAKPKPKSKK